MPLALQILEQLEAPCAYLIHIGHDLDAERLDATTPLPPPPGIRFAHYGLAL